MSTETLEKPVGPVPPDEGNGSSHELAEATAAPVTTTETAASETVNAAAAQPEVAAPEAVVAPVATAVPASATPEVAEAAVAGDYPSGTDSSGEGKSRGAESSKATVSGTTASRASGKAAPRPPSSSIEDMLRIEKAGGLVMVARAALRKGQREEARRNLQNAFQLNPTDVGALEILGDLFLEEGEQQKAIAVFEKGLKLHPHHAAFEEKMALARLDLAEMERDRILRQQLIEQGDTESWQDRNPNLAAFLSLMLPGTGQFYNEEYEKGVAFLSISVLTFAAWFWPLSAAVKRVTEAGNISPGAYGGLISQAFADMGGVTKFLILSMIGVWLTTYVFSAWDAARSAVRAAEDRKRNLGIGI
jgi:tetratricopeptide (TPR) repeat protein